MTCEDQAGSRFEIWEDTLGKGTGWGKGPDKQKQGEFGKQNNLSWVCLKNIGRVYWKGPL